MLTSGTSRISSAWLLLEKRNWRTAFPWQRGSATGRSRRVNAPGSPVWGFFRRLLGLVLLVALLWSGWVVYRINQVAHEDQAQPADAIVVFGAAEYAGRPSPVFHARLDKAVSLYQRQMAPLVITLGGGSDRDSGKTEGGVGRDYLLAEGVPFSSILAETHSFTTGQQVKRLAEIAREQKLQHMIVVSDPTHLFRIKVLCEQAGLDVYTSPRAPLGHIDDFALAMRYMHEILSYTALRLDLTDTRVYRWMDRKGDE